MDQDRSQAVEDSLRTGSRLLQVALLALLSLGPASAMDFPGASPGPARSQGGPGQGLTLSNRALAATWSVTHGSFRASALRDRLAGRSLPPPAEAFVLVFRDGRRLPASAMRAAALRPGSLAADPSAVGEAERRGGREVSTQLVSPDGTVRVVWRALLRDGAAHVRQCLRVEALRDSVDLAKVVLVDQELPGAQVVGRVPGSPVVAGSVFMGCEHPMATAAVAEGSLVTCGLDLPLPIAVGRPLEVSSVLGVTPAGQLRRGFLHYLELERAHAYRPFLHYNSWYDIGYFTPYSEADCLGVIRALGEELVRKRGVKLDSLLFDDGWDDTARGGEWAFHKGFPQGFLLVKAAAAAIGAEPGVWLSPWGGYGPPRIARRKSGQAAGFEVLRDPGEKSADYGQLFALSGPRYFESFRRACLEMVTRHGINHFKLDGTGSLGTVVPGSRFGSDFEAAIALIRELRQAKPDLFINLTTGTWPSPFWLPICDSIWRGGEDHDFEGPGPDRERWITYRDADTYQGIVQAGPLYPLNALMLHGILYAKGAKGLNTGGGVPFLHEVRSYFGSGTQLQELYISHGLLAPADWDALAEGARWARAHAATLVDTHWVGGDPRRLEVYGWAAWGAGQGVLTLRNPAAEPRTYTLDLARALELPAGAPTALRLTPAFSQRALPGLEGRRDPRRPITVQLEPFEVLVFEARPPGPPQGPRSVRAGL